jgi:hypothetical protein
MTAVAMSGSRKAAEMPCDWATAGTVSAAIVTPSGWQTWRMPMARPRRSFENQPTTTLPLAELVLADAAPPSSRNTPSSTYPCDSSAPTAARAVSASPPAITHFSPMRSVSAPQSTSVSTRPIVGMAASRPACARLSPRSVCSRGMRNAGVATKTVPKVCARTPRPSAVQARRARTMGGMVSMAVISSLSR